MFQEALLKTPPETLDHARETAKRIEAAQVARKIMRPKRSDVLPVTTAETQDEGKLTVTESADYVQQRVAAVAEQRQEDSLMEPVRRNTEMLERLLGQMTLRGNSTQRPPPDGGLQRAGGVDRGATSDENALVRETSSGWRLGSIASRELSK